MARQTQTTRKGCQRFLFRIFKRMKTPRENCRHKALHNMAKAIVVVAVPAKDWL